MALSQRKTTVAILRGILGPIYGQERRFAKLVGRSPSWVKKVSAGIVPLTETTGRMIEHETGAPLKWLLAPANQPPTVYGFSGEPIRQPYTREYFEWFRAKLKTGEPVVQSAFSIAAFLPDLVAVGVAAAQSQRAALFIWRLQSFTARLREQFGSCETAKKRALLLLQTKEGAVTLQPSGEAIALRDVWFVDKSRRKRLPFDLGSRVAQEIGEKGFDQVKIKAPELDAKTLGRRAEAIYRPVPPTRKKGGQSA
jgi:hypothetical protein